jgi:hypothetical protein
MDPPPRLRRGGRGLPDTVEAESCKITAAAFGRRLSRAPRAIRRAIDNRSGPVGPADPCRCRRQFESGPVVGILDRDGPNFARRSRVADTVSVDARPQSVAAQLDSAVAIGEPYRVDRVAAPQAVWERVQRARPDLLAVPAGGVRG